MSSAAVPRSWQEVLFLLIWYCTEYLCYISIIAYVGYTFGLIKPYKMKKDVPATFGDTWSQTSSFLTTAVDIAQKVNTVMDGSKPKEGGSKPKTEKKE